MIDQYPSLRMIYLTFPDRDRAVLNLQTVEFQTSLRFELTRNQLFDLNAQTADALQKGKPE